MMHVSTDDVTYKTVSFANAKLTCHGKLIWHTLAHYHPNTSSALQ
jgi:hypothetical protein